MSYKNILLTFRTKYLNTNKRLEINEKNQCRSVNKCEFYKLTCVMIRFTISVW